MNLLAFKPLDHSFNETNKLYTFLIKPLWFPVIEIRLSVTNWTYTQTSLLTTSETATKKSYFITILHF